MTGYVTQVRYVIGFVPESPNVLVAGIGGSHVAMGAGWYRFIYDDDGREAINAGPFNSADEALCAPSKPTSEQSSG